MESVTVIIMEKDKETGFLEKEIGSFTVEEHGELIERIYMTTEEGKQIVHMIVTTSRDVEDEEFASILDSYDGEAMEQVILSIEEVEDTYNPTWEVTFPYVDSQDGMEERMQRILNAHYGELRRIDEELQK